MNVYSTVGSIAGMVSVYAQKHIPLIVQAASGLRAKSGSISSWGQCESIYRGQEGQQIPVYSKYRYSIKPCWDVFPGLDALGYLYRLNLLREPLREFFVQAVGQRAVCVTQSDSLEAANSAIKQNKNLFTTDFHDLYSLPCRRVSSDYVERQIRHWTLKHSVIQGQLGLCHKLSARKRRALEIGYISGGASLLALDRMGFDTFGIDNFYEQGHQRLPTKHLMYQEVASTAVEFQVGNICSRTPFEPDFFDVVYSFSVIEHIKDIQSAFEEIYRILKPGGFAIHSYNPFHSYNGGHAYGMGDSPWAHSQLSNNDYLRYIKDLRPMESELAVRWIKDSLNRDTTISHVQRKLTYTGFEIIKWKQSTNAVSWSDHLSVEVLSNCFAVNPDISLQDLISSNITFVARKL